MRRTTRFQDGLSRYSRTASPVKMTLKPTQSIQDFFLIGLGLEMPSSRSCSALLKGHPAAFTKDRPCLVSSYSLSSDEDSELSGSRGAFRDRRAWRGGILVRVRSRRRKAKGKDWYTLGRVEERCWAVTKGMRQSSWGYGYIDKVHRP